jgi:hypothetical protein
MSQFSRKFFNATLALVFGALLVFGSAFDAQGQGRRGSRVWDRYDRHDRGRHLGWERGRRVGLRRRAERRTRREWRRDRREWRRERRQDRRALRRDRWRDRRNS